MNPKVYIKKSGTFGQNIEITNFVDGIGINLTAREYDTSTKLTKTCWVTFPLEQAKDIRKLLDKTIKQHEDDVKQGKYKHDWALIK